MSQSLPTSWRENSWHMDNGMKKLRHYHHVRTWNLTFAMHGKPTNKHLTESVLALWAIDVRQVLWAVSHQTMSVQRWWNQPPSACVMFLMVAVRISVVAEWWRCFAAAETRLMTSSSHCTPPLTDCLPAAEDGSVGRRRHSNADAKNWRQRRTLPQHHPSPAASLKQQIIPLSTFADISAILLEF